MEFFEVAGSSMMENIPFEIMVPCLLEQFKELRLSRVLEKRNAKLTDKIFATLLTRVNACETTRFLHIQGCTKIIGAGLEPLLLKLRLYIMCLHANQTTAWLTIKIDQSNYKLSLLNSVCILPFTIG
jgi:hypothetical protein